MQRGLVRLFAIGVVLIGLTTTVYAGQTVVVTDLAQRRVEAPLNPGRIICLSPGCLRLICYLNRADRVVGVEQFEKVRLAGRPYRLAHPELGALPSVGPGGPTSINSEPDLEAVLRLKPEVIFITYMQADKADVLQKKIGIPVVVLTYGKFGTFDDVVFQSLQVAGTVLGTGPRAGQVASFVQAARDDLKRRTSGIDEKSKPCVYVGGVGFKGVQGIESTDAAYVPLEWVGARNVAKGPGRTGHMFVDKEQVLKWDPDVIFIDGGGLDLVHQDRIKKPEFYTALGAVKCGRVYRLYPFNWYMTNIGTAIADAYTAGKVLYPDRFQDIDPDRKADEIYRFLLGKSMNEAMAGSYGRLGSLTLCGDK